MPDIDIGGVAEAVRLAWELISSYKGGTYCQGDICNNTAYDMRLRKIVEWQGNFVDADYTLDQTIGANRADVFLHGTNGGLNGAMVAAVYNVGPVDLMVGGWITNSAIGEKMLACGMADAGKMPTDDASMRKSKLWAHNHKIPSVQTHVVGGEVFELATQMTAKETDPPRWGGHWQLLSRPAA